VSSGIEGRHPSFWGQYSLGGYGLAAPLLPEVSPSTMTITASDEGLLLMCSQLMSFC